MRIKEMFKKLWGLRKLVILEPSNIVVDKKITDTFLKTKFSV